MLAVTAPFRLPLSWLISKVFMVWSWYGEEEVAYKLMAMPMTALRLYDPSTLLDTQALSHMSEVRDHDDGILQGICCLGLGW